MVFLVEAFFSGCVSKIVNDGTDYSKSTIQSVIFDKKNQDFSTKIYRVIERALNASTYNKYKNKDILYNATEKLFLNFKENENNIEAVKACLSEIIPDVDRVTCEKFIEKFFDEICRDDYLFKRVTFVLEEKGIKYNQNEFLQLKEMIKKNHDEIIETIKEFNSEYVKSGIGEKIKFKNNKKQDYIKDWNSRLFLHIDNDERPITLADAFIMPDCKLHKCIERVGFTNKDSLEKIIDRFVKYEKTSTMLIIGLPGIGKSSITSWIANKYKNNDGVIVLRFRDWDSMELRNGLLEAICDMLECNRQDLEDKILVLDGFDEVKALKIRNELLNDFFNDIKDLNVFKIIITSRPGYIDSTYFQNVFELENFNIDKIDIFYKTITGNLLDKKEKIESNLEVLGIPVILYMAIMSNVDISENPTKPELYNCIFSEKGGIFDKFFDGKSEYSIGKQIFRNPENIKKYLKFLQEVAFDMFEKNNFILTKNEYKIPKLNFQGQKLKIVEFPIKPFLESDGYNIEFIHNSIYEYFISEYIIAKIEEKINGTKEGLAGVLGILFKKGMLSKEIIDFLKYKITKIELKNKFDVVNSTFQLMIQDGMTYYTKKCYKGVIKCEMNIFSNMLEIIHLWEKEYLVYSNLFLEYIRYNKNSMLNLKNIHINDIDNFYGFGDLSYVYLKGADLQGTNLLESKFNEKYGQVGFVNADLSGANLKMLNLRYINLMGADLTGADLTGADLTGTNLIFAKLMDIILDRTTLENTILDESQVRLLKNKYSLRRVQVYSMSTGDMMNYMEYCYHLGSMNSPL